MRIVVFIIFCLCEVSFSLLCFNCSSTNLDEPGCAGDFAKPNFGFNSTRKLLANCTGDETMCFVRSWVARAKHAWIVQRGCYEVHKGDLLPRSMRGPMRSMSCKQERFPEAEYKVCFCQADWCNSSPLQQTTKLHLLFIVLTCSYVLKLFFFNLPVIYDLIVNVKCNKR